MTVTKITFPARDGYELSGLMVTADAPKAGVIVSAGTGFPKEYYRRFAQLGAQRGLTTLLYDNRGIGGSAPDNLAAMEMHYSDWGRYDLCGAVDAIKAQTNGAPIGHIAHSVGGHFLGLLDNIQDIKAHAFVCVGSGYWRHHHFKNQLMEFWFWHIYGRLMIATKGYLPKGGGWGGAPLPRGIIEPWREWCHRKDYHLRDFEGLMQPHQNHAVTAAIRSFIYTDDPIANARTAPVILAAYPNAQSEIVMRDPKTYGLKAIGHNGPFSRKTLAAAPEIWDWLAQQL